MAYRAALAPSAGSQVGLASTQVLSSQMSSVRGTGATESPNQSDAETDVATTDESDTEETTTTQQQQLETNRARAQRTRLRKMQALDPAGGGGGVGADDPDAAPQQRAKPVNLAMSTTPRKLRLSSAPHTPWGRAYEHPTLISPSGRRLPVPPPMSAATTDGFSPRGAATMEEKTGEPSTQAERHSHAARLREAQQVGQLTSRLVNTVAPPAAPYTAFSEASRYHDIIHPAESPRSMLLAKLAAPEPIHHLPPSASSPSSHNGRKKLKPATQKDGLPLAAHVWHLSKQGQDGFEASLSERDARLFGDRHSGVTATSASLVAAAEQRTPKIAPGSSSSARAQTRARRAQARQELASQQALALQMGLLPGASASPSGVWAGLALTPRPRTSNDPRGRKEVLNMLDAFRATPRGHQVLQMQEQARDQQRERDAAAMWAREADQMAQQQQQQQGMPLQPQEQFQQQRALLQSAPSGLTQRSVPFSPRSFARAVGSATGGHASTARSATAQGFSSPFNGAASARAHSTPGRASTSGGMGHGLGLVSPGFFPASPSAASPGRAYPSSFHAHLGSTARAASSTSASSGAGSASGASSGTGGPGVASFHRVLPPSFMNTPARIEHAVQSAGAKQARERIRAGAQDTDQVRRFHFPGALVQDRRQPIKKRADDLVEPSSAPATNRATPIAGTPAPALPLASELDWSVELAAIRDYAVRALACNRAGRRAAEANAHYCMGVLWDNVRQHLKAIECYTRFKTILCPPPRADGMPNQHRTAEDAFAEALAQNSLGVSYQSLGPAYYQRALVHHALHRDVADLPGRFIALTNLGLVHQLMAKRALDGPTGSDASNDDSFGEEVARSHTEAAAFNHQGALRCALQMSSLAGQNLAIGNLGLTGLQHADLATARACMERHLQLSQALDDARGQAVAYEALGRIAARGGEHAEAQLFFASQVQLAHVLRDPHAADQAKVALGVAKANAQMAQLLQTASRTIMGADEEDFDHDDDYE